MHSSHRDDLQNTHREMAQRSTDAGSCKSPDGATTPTGPIGSATSITSTTAKNVDLVNHPELAADPGIAARIAVEGMCAMERSLAASLGIM